jgi:Ca-activated chloride channel family protein
MNRRPFTPLHRTPILAVAGLVALIGAAGLAHAGSTPETGTIEGVVTDLATGQPLDRVRCSAVRFESVTGASGRFTIKRVPPGDRNVVCRRPGYYKAAQLVKVVAGETMRADFKMRARAEKEPKPVATKTEEKEKDIRRLPKTPAPEPEPAPVAAEESVGDVLMDAPAAAGATRSGRGAPAKVLAKRPTRRPRMHRAYAPPAASIATTAAPIQQRPAGPQGGEAFNREGYEHRTDNPFKTTGEDPRSTFSIDVDTAGYANIRRFLDAGRLPPVDAVKIEEMVNYFRYDYPEPAGEDPFAIHTEVSVAPWKPQHKLVHIGLQGRRIETGKLPPSNLVFLLDVSGSMNSPNKLPLVKQAMKMLVAELRPQDRVAMVVYAGAAGLVLPSTAGTDTGAILRAIDRLNAGGSTAGGAGIRLAYQVARENFREGGNNRVILATDGDFNVGTSSDSELVRMIENERESGVFLTVLGFGTGNYQDAKMEKLADHGNGNHAYIDSVLEAKKVLVSEMGGTLFTIAKDVKIQVEFNPTHVKAWRLIGYENRILRHQDFDNDKKDAGELGAGHTVTALYEVVPAGIDSDIPGVTPLKYQAHNLTPAAQSEELMQVKLRYKQPDGHTSKLLAHTIPHQASALAEASDDFRFSSAVAELGLLLRNSEHKGNASYEALVERARAATGDDAEGWRADFVKLAQKARTIAGASAARVAR